jgi:hypothetical protein
MSVGRRVGPEGIEPTPYGLKIRHAACYTTTLDVEACTFAAMRHWFAPFRLSLSVVALRIELSALWLSAGVGQPARDYRVVTCALASQPARTVGREALESSSAALQTAARPSQLPTQFANSHEKSPVSL